MEAERDKLRAELGSLEEAAELARKQLPLWSGSLADLEAAPAPALESIERFEAAFRDDSGRRALLEQRTTDIRARQSDVERQIRQLSLQQEVPSENDLSRARQRREESWLQIRQHWLAGGSTKPGTEVSQEQLAQTYEELVANADLLSDRLRREAERVTQMAALLAQRDQLSVDEKQLAAERDAATANDKRLQGEWQAFWQPIGINPLPPREMQNWVRRRDELLVQAGRTRDARNRWAQVQAVIAEQFGMLKLCLQQMAEPPAQDATSLAALVRHGRRVLQTLEERLRSQAQHEAERKNRIQELESLRSQLRLAQDQMQEWRRTWAAAMSRLKLPDDTGADRAGIHLDALDALQAKLNELSGFKARIAGIDRDEDNLLTAVRTLVGRLESAPPETVALDRLLQLHSRLKQAQRDQQARQALERRVLEADKELQAAQAVWAESRARLEALCREAACQSPQDLPAAEQRSHERRGRDQRLVELERRIALESAGQEVAAFAAEALEENPDQLGERLRLHEEELQALDREREQLHQTIGSEQTTLAALAAGGTATDAAMRVEDLLAALRMNVERYICLKLAEAVLQRGLERYRDKNKSPILDRAAAIFAQLTAGSFAGLRPDFDDEGKEVLFGVRSGSNSLLGVAAMSSGAQDQLYLAIRMASLEDWLKKHEPLPLIVDDLLINFDDERAAAALRVLAELSERTQVLFFTHHAHLLEVARRAVPNGQLFTHELRT